MRYMLKGSYVSVNAQVTWLILMGCNMNAQGKSGQVLSNVHIADKSLVCLWING